ncbi:MAG: choice-of-anchor J domain-containing protein [Bacteroidales bacterium]|nr:choice-of-anchor J domain-containing protein [Bacteroidales bacterium]
MKLKFMVLINAIVIGLSINVFGQDCNPPVNVNTVTPHTPDWYSVNITWNVPSAAKSSIVFSNGPIITHPGQGYNGADVSVMGDGATMIGFIGNQELNYSIADDFTLTSATQIDSIQFYTVQTLVSDPAPNANVKEIYIQIYDAAPNAGGQVIWGDMTTDRKKQVIFPNYYRAPEYDITINTVPIMRTTANIGTSLSAGTYWIEVTVTSIIPANPPQNARIVFPPVTIPGQASVGNALWKVDGVWQDMIDEGNNGHGGLPMEMYGETSNVQYNVYRDNTKLTSSPIGNFSYFDIAPQEGSYVYGVTAVYSDGCESQKATSTVVLEKNPCELATEVTDDYAQGFESGIPLCWTQDADGQNKYWEAVLGTESEPATTHSGSRKLLFKASGNAITKIITEMFDISKLNNPELGFWHAQKASGNFQDELRVYYKTGESASWEKIGEYASNVADWTWTTIELPKANATYWIAFEAIGKGGFGIMLDDVMIQEKGGAGCTSPRDLTYTINTPIEEWYNVDLFWNFPENSMPGDAMELWNNGPIITHPGEGFDGADVSVSENPQDIGFNTDQLSGYSVADDFTLEKPTYIEYMTFYLYERFTVNNNPEYIDMLFVKIYDKSPKEGGKEIWGNTQDNKINRDLTAFSNIYRTYPENLQSPAYPVMRVVADIDLNLPAGAYWVEIIAVSKIAPYEGGCIWAIPVTKLGEPFNGNAIQSYGKDWHDLMGTTGQCALPFEVFGKQMPLTYDVYRDDEKINDVPIALNNYTDVAPGEGTYNYCVKAVWENGCISNGTCAAVIMPQDPCAPAVSTFPFYENFAGSGENILGEKCWRQYYVVTDPEDGQGWNWEVVPADYSEPNTAVDGANKAIFYTTFGYATKLISPMLDLSQLDAPTLNFWHVQKQWDGDQSQLRLYYKNAIDGEWIQLEEWKNNIPDWVEETISLPEPTATYWLAFEGEGHLGYPVMLDAITVDGNTGLENGDMEEIRIFPNPATNQVNILSKDIVKIEVYNVMGQLVVEKTTDISSMNISSLNAGIYLFKIFNKLNDVAIKRVVITR